MTELPAIRGLVRLLVAAVAILAAVPVGVAASPARNARVAIPIERTVLLDGVVRYSVNIKIGDIGPIPALLDTGSTGLLVLKRALGKKQPRKIGTFSYGYDSGDTLGGIISRARISVGGFTTDGGIPFGVVQAQSCMKEKPRCSSGQLKPEEFGIGGDAIPGEGFAAILGIGIDRNLLPNPIAWSNEAAWIVNLPQPGRPGPGELILNPDAADLAGFTMFPIDKSHRKHRGPLRTALPGCLSEPSSGLDVCGAVTLDTGTPLVVVRMASLPARPPRPTGQRFDLAFGGEGSELPLSFQADYVPPRLISFERASKEPLPTIHAGVLPYLSYSVYYDFRGGRIGFRQR